MSEDEEERERKAKHFMLSMINSDYYSSQQTLSMMALSNNLESGRSRSDLDSMSDCHSSGQEYDSTYGHDSLYGQDSYDLSLVTSSSDIGGVRPRTTMETGTGTGTRTGSGTRTISLGMGIEISEEVIEKLKDNVKSRAQIRTVSP